MYDLWLEVLRLIDAPVVCIKGLERESNPIKVAKYAVVNNLVDELDFSGWVPFTLKWLGTVHTEVKRADH